MNETATQKKTPVGFAIFLIIASLIGLTAAFALTLEKLVMLEHPDAHLSCNFSVIVQCGKNLASWQGSTFGFPNPILGLVAWPVVLATAVGLLAGAKFARWYWIAFTAVAALGLAFVIFLISQSIFVLGTLCPWCMVTWSAVIPLFIITTLWTTAQGVFGGSAALRSRAAALLTWSPTIVLAAYLLVAVIAQLRLDFLATL